MRDDADDGGEEVSTALTSVPDEPGAGVATASAVGDGPEGERRPNWRGVSFMSFAHLVHDGYLGTLGVLLPFLRAELGFSLLFAGFLGPAQQLGSLLQPVMGALGDRFGTKRFVVISVAVTGAAMSLVAVSPSFAVVAMLVFIGGLSSAVYHPNGSVLLTNQAGGRWGLALAVYSFGGNIGLALGPLVATVLLTIWGLHSVGLMAIPAIVLSGVLALMLRGVVEQRRRPTGEHAGWRWWRRERRNLSLIAVIILGRAAGAGGLTLFLPTLLHDRGYSIGVVGLITTSYFAVGGVGGLLSGWLSDRLGRLTVMAANMVIAPVAWFTFVNTDGPYALIPLLIAAACLLGHQPVMTALGQEMYPHRRGTIVGYTLGASFVLQSAGTLAVGGLAAVIGLTSAFSWLAFSPLLALPAIYGLHRVLQARSAPEESTDSHDVEGTGVA